MATLGLKPSKSYLKRTVWWVLIIKLGYSFEEVLSDVLQLNYGLYFTSPDQNYACLRYICLHFTGEREDMEFVEYHNVINRKYCIASSIILKCRSY